MYNNQMREARLKKGITLEELSEKTGISSGYLCHLERGSRKNPSVHIMDKIAIALNTSVSEIFFK